MCRRGGSGLANRWRVLLTGIHLMRSGEVEAHLPTLLGYVTAPGYVRELLAAKAEAEHGPMDGTVDWERLRADVTALHAELDEAQAACRLPESPSAYDALHDLVVRTRTGD
jgi:hypothetical protein